ncbi:MAG: hypothetical protein OXG37_10360 [Actinomycetia bacterium]|nr:hypothetical protein [Actinomycetes bacterium]
MVTGLGEEGLTSANARLADLFRLLRERTATVAGLGKAVYEAGIDLRYEGQEYSLTVQPPLADEQIAASVTESRRSSSVATSARTAIRWMRPGRSSPFAQRPEPSCLARTSAL